MRRGVKKGRKEDRKIRKAKGHESLSEKEVNKARKKKIYKQREENRNQRQTGKKNRVNEEDKDKNERLRVRQRREVVGSLKEEEKGDGAIW